MYKSLKNLKIFITAGSTWVPLDKVRVLTNIFSGRTGLSIAIQAANQGAKVVLALGPTRLQVKNNIPNLKIIPFKYFDYLHKLVKKEISKKIYDVCIHSAAVSDYKPLNTSGGKIKSNKKHLTITFVPTIKIVDQIKKYDSDIVLVKFKLEVNKTRAKLLDIAKKSMLYSKADFIVANDLLELGNKHRAFIMDSFFNVTEVKGNKKLSIALLKNINNFIHNKE
ncbi:MAG: phosphopantothenoylcysteine decarboxylase [Candidatus Omnitrophica bacterium]|nr:phosphopantothenoylcysteine decarboxylase [Candidatus Omnitrophota bacterium]